MHDPIPPEFDTDFLDWFRERTEQAWARYQTRDFFAARVGGRDWQRGTRWLDGLTDDEIDEAERRWSIRFPPDYRFFLRCLHTTDRPMAGARFIGDKLTPADWPSFYNWQRDTDALQEAFNWPMEGLLFDVEHNNLWRPSWGQRPDSRPERERLVRGLAATAPRLIPVFGHRYLLAEPFRRGNPVLSIYQTDVIVYGGDLRRYLLAELGGLLDIAGSRGRADATATTLDLASIPFWSESWGF